MRYLPLLLLAAACAPNPQAPVKVAALLPKTPGNYEPVEVELKTIKDVVALKGDAATFIGGARIVMDPSDPVDLPDDNYARLITKNAGGDVHVNFISKDDVLWPADFDSWNLVTSYYNFEKASEYFVTTGLTSAELAGAKVYYFPEFEDRSVSNTPIKDNAAFLQPLRAFILLPFDKLQKVPLPLNPGIISHEYAHRVWNMKVYAGRGQPEVFSRWLGSGGTHGGLNLVKAMDEGFADYHAYSASFIFSGGVDPRFTKASLPDDIAARRDLSQANRCLPTATRQSLETQNARDFLVAGNDYIVGTVIASSLYQAGEKTGKRQDLQRALVATYSDDTAATLGFRQIINANLDSPANFKLELVMNALLAHIPDLELRKAACNELWARLKLDVAAVPSCPATSSPVQDCVGVP